MEVKLSELGFYYTKPGEHKIGGINFDIFSETESQRTMRSLVKRAFGEAKSVKCSKKLAEDYVHKMRDIQGREYSPDRGDYVFLISPEITPDARRVLNDAGIDWISFNPPEIQEYLKVSEEAPKEEVPIFKRRKPNKYSLKDVTGIGDAIFKQLNSVGIETIEYIITCNPKIVSVAMKRKFPRRIEEGRIKSFQTLT